MLSYCKRLGVALEPFVQVNYNAYVHSSKAFGGKPQRYREIKADYQGHVAELLAKATQQNALDAAVSKEDQEKLLDSLRDWGALDKNYAYVDERLQPAIGAAIEKDPGGGLSARPSSFRAHRPERSAELRALGSAIPSANATTCRRRMFQPVGGMGRIGEAFGRELGPLIRYNAKVIDIQQDEHGVSVTLRGHAHRRGRPPDGAARTGACAPFRCRSSARFR